MPRQETILTIFVASPSDVDEERNKLEEVIREQNNAWAHELGIRLELVRWETHAYPSFGEDAQAVINEQISDDYDIFIGLMWYRFGTPTGRAGSGTIEEFQQAKKRFDQDPSSLQLMIYFKDKPVPVAPTKLDNDQLIKLGEFRDSLGDEGGLYWSFSSIENFEKLIRLHLTRYVQAWKRKESTSQSPKTIPVSDTSKKEPEPTDGHSEEAGMLDLMEQFEDEFEALVEIMERITVATNDIGEKMQARTKETQNFSSGPKSKNRKVAKRLIAKAAIDMDQYVHRMEAEVPLFSEHLSTGMNALIQASQLSIDFTIDSDDLSQIEENLDGVKAFYKTLATVEGQITEFQQAVGTLPRMTTKLNRSKKAVVNVLQQLIQALQSGQGMAQEAEKSLTQILKSN